MDAKDHFFARYGDLCDLMNHGAETTLRINGYHELAGKIEAARAELDAMQIVCDAMTRPFVGMLDEYAPIDGCSKDLFDALWDRHETARQRFMTLMREALDLREAARDARHAANPLGDLGEGP